jgi:hypothetical protein
MAPPILKMEMKMGGLRVWEKKNQVRHTWTTKDTTTKENSPCDGKCDQQRDQLYETHAN